MTHSDENINSILLLLNNSKKEIIQPNHSNILFSKKISKIKNKKNFRENKLIQNYSSSFVKNKNKKVKSNLKSYNKIFENKKIYQIIIQRLLIILK